MSSYDKKNNKEELESLVLEVQAGDQDAFGKVYDLLIDQVYRYVFYRVNKSDVEDVVETVFLKVWENVRSYRSGKGKSFSAWVFRIAHNLVVDYYRGAKDRNFDELLFNVPDTKREHNPIRNVETVLSQDHLKKAIYGLKDSYRDILIHKFVNDLSNGEIAELLRKSEGSVRILQMRALNALKAEFDKMGVKYDV